MAEFRLTSKAVEDLANIWEYTFKDWSEKQADKYYSMLIVFCQKIADNPDVGKTYYGTAENLFGMKINRHIIFYRTLDKSYVEITRVLHESMDMQKSIIQ